MDGFIIDSEYSGYVFVGGAVGQFENDRKEKIPYCNMYVLSPVSDYKSEDYSAFGYKAEKVKCVSPDVWKELNLGDHVKLFFDEKRRVALAALDG